MQKINVFHRGAIRDRLATPSRLINRPSLRRDRGAHRSRFHFSQLRSSVLRPEENVASRRSPIVVPYQSGAGLSTSSRSHCIIGGFPLGRGFCPGIVPIGGRCDAFRSACCVSRCLLRSTLRWKARPQSSQANGLKPVCFLECVIRLLLCENALPHT